MHLLWAGCEKICLCRACCLHQACSGWGSGFPLPCRLCLLRHTINSPGVTGSSLPSRGAGLRFPDAVLSHNLWCQTRPLFSQEQKGRTKRYYEIKQQYSAGRLTPSYCLICSKVGRSWLLLASPIIWPHTAGLSSAAGMLQPSHCFILMKKSWRRDCQDELSALYSPITFFFFFWNKAGHFRPVETWEFRIF